MQPDRAYPGRLYPDTALFQEVRRLMQDPPSTEPRPLGLFGEGEAAAIPLAQQLDAALLINDRRPAGFARSLGVPVFTVPDMVLIAQSQGLVPDHMARAMLAACQQHGTSPDLVAQADEMLSALESPPGSA